MIIWDNKWVFVEVTERDLVKCPLFKKISLETPVGHFFSQFL